jgi:nitroreductase
MDAFDALLTRRSIRHFSSQPVPRDLIEKIVDAGRMAASACNEQPWEFIVVTDPAVRAQLAELSIHGKFIAESPACIVVFSKMWDFFLEDCAAATQNLLVAARALDLGTCWVAGDKKPTAPQICSLLGVPEGYRLVSLVAVGYADTTSRVRNPPKRTLQEVLHWEKF